MSTPQQILGQTLTTLAFCWRLDRRDGVTIGLASHDRDLAIGGLVYRAAPGLVPSAVTRETRLEAETMDIHGALTSDAISAEDLELGRWDGAALHLHLTEWAEPGVLWLELARGELGQIERRGDAFSVEMKGPGAALAVSIVPETSPSCRARLGDAACRVNLARHRRIARVAASSGQYVDIEGGGMTPGAFAFGTLRWMSGRATGLTQPISDNDASRLMLDDAPLVEPEAGALVLLSEGCDKRIETCAARFSNAVNFRGEPYLPGIDLLSRYPGA